MTRREMLTIIRERLQQYLADKGAPDQQYGLCRYCACTVRDYAERTAIYDELAEVFEELGITTQSFYIGGERGRTPARVAAAYKLLDYYGVQT